MREGKSGSVLYLHLGVPYPDASWARDVENVSRLLAFAMGLVTASLFGSSIGPVQIRVPEHRRLVQETGTDSNSI